MKMHTLKKVLSVICVLAVMLSVCVVSFAGGSSAAGGGTEYTFNNAGKVSKVQLNAGDALPTPEAAVNRAEFLGWVGADGTTIQTIAGADTTLYAKYAEGVYTFNDSTDTNKNGIYDPNNRWNKGYMASYSFVEDPVTKVSGNNVIKLREDFYEGGVRKHANASVVAFANIDGTGMVFEKGATYRIYFKYHIAQLSRNPIQIMPYISSASGIGVSTPQGQPSNKTAVKIYGASFRSDIPASGYGGISLGNTITAEGEWIDAYIDVKIDSSVPDDHKYFLFRCGSATDKIAEEDDPGLVYFDDFVVAKIQESEYTFYNKGVKTTKTTTNMSAIPVVAGGTAFKGWYDVNLKQSYTVVPTNCKTLVAVYSTLNLSFDHKGHYGTPVGFTAQGGAMKADLSTSATASFKFAAAEGANAGYKPTQGEIYILAIKYKASNVNASGAQFILKGVDAAGNATASLGTANITKNTTDWATAEIEFTLNDATKPYLALYVQDKNATTPSAKIEIDSAEVYFAEPPAVAPDLVMDFENNFKWSIDAANKYTASSGNGYVTRGEIVTVDGSKVFRLKHFKNKNGYFYFVLGNATTLGKLTNGGIYTVEFDYKVESSITNTKLGLITLKASAGSGAFTAADEIELDAFTVRSDDEWEHASYTFIADLPDPDHTNIAIYLKNSTSVPEELATSVIFDNIVLKTYSIEGDDGLIQFDSKGGSDCRHVAVNPGKTPRNLPTPYKYGYVFTGWKYDTKVGGATVTKDLTTKTVISAGITHAYATWKLRDDAIALTVRTNNDDYDLDTPPIVAVPGKPIEVMPADPTYPDQEFVGWYLDKSLTVPLNINKAPKESCTIYAKWKSNGYHVTFDGYPKTLTGNSALVSDRYQIITDPENKDNKVLYYYLQNGSNKSASAVARAMLHNGYQQITIVTDVQYKVTFKYKITDYKEAGTCTFFTSSANSTWSNYTQMVGKFDINGNTDGWQEAEMSFPAYTETDDAIFLSIGFGSNAKIYIDDVVIYSDDNVMNLYDSVIRFNTLGGQYLDPICGAPGETIKLPKPVRKGYQFLGWFTDKKTENEFTETQYGDTNVMLYAKWSVGRYEEGFEKFPTTVQTLGVHGAYSMYKAGVEGFDASNVHSGSTSLFRNGASAGVKAFTTMRDVGFELTPDEEYTLTMYVKPTSVGDANATINLMDMKLYTGIRSGAISDVVCKISDLKVGEWNEVTYTFVAKQKYLALATGAGNDLYIDDISVNLVGYTGATTGDSSINPIVVLAIALVAAGALLITGKKVYSK